MNAFIFALDGFNGKGVGKLPDADDWRNSAEAIIMDIQTSIANDIPSTLSSTLSAVANPVNEFNDNVSITIGSGTDQAGKQTGIKDTK